MKINLLSTARLFIVFVFILLGSYTSMYACDSLIVKGTITASGSPNGVVIKVYEIINGIQNERASGTANSSGWYYIDVTHLFYDDGNNFIVKALCCDNAVGINKTTLPYNFGVECRKTVNINCSGECNP